MLTYSWESIIPCTCIEMQVCSEKTQEGPRFSLLVLFESLCKQEVKAKTEFSSAGLIVVKYYWSLVRIGAIKKGSPRRNFNIPLAKPSWKPGGLGTQDVSKSKTTVPIEVGLALAIMHLSIKRKC